MKDVESLVSLYRAQKLLLGMFTFRDHRSTCPMEDVDSIAPCNCGAADHNMVVESLHKLVDKNFKDKMAEV